MGLDTFIKDKKGNEIYWRKANFLHKWFADRLYPDGEDDNLNEKSFPATWLDELESTCNKALENPKKAKSLLPTSSGFFFGSQEYDDWYREHLKYTINQIQKLRGQYSPKEWKRAKLSFESWY